MIKFISLLLIALPLINIPVTDTGGYKTGCGVPSTKAKEVSIIETVEETDNEKISESDDDNINVYDYFTSYEVSLAACMLESESINLPGEESVRPLWCALNRLDSSKFPDTLQGVFLQPGQWLKEWWEPSESHKRVVEEQLTLYIRWKNGEDINRPLPEGLYFYGGNGRYNQFRTTYLFEDSTRYWAQGNWLN